MFKSLTGKKWPFIVGGMIVLAIIGSLSNGGNTASTSSTSQPDATETKEPVAATKPLGGYCLVTMKYLDEVVQILGNAIDYPVGEITAKLKENGELLTQGYDSTLIPNPDDLQLVKEAGHQMLQIRARLIDGGDALVPGQELLKSYSSIGAICR